MDKTVQIYDNVLRCPHCGGNNTHHFSMTYERNEDDREKDIAISFRCEGCRRAAQQTLAPFGHLARLGKRKDLRLSVRHSVRRWRLSAAQTSNVSIGNG